MQVQVMHYSVWALLIPEKLVFFSVLTRAFLIAEKKMKLFNVERKINILQ